MEDKAVRGVPWTILGFAAARGTALLGTIALAQLLSPREFGLVAVGTIVVGLLGLVADSGLGNTLVLRQDLSLAAQRTVLTLMLGLGLLTGVAMAALAAPASRALGQPDAADVVAVLAAALPLIGLVAFYDQLIRRELEFRRQFAGLMAQSVTYVAVAVGLAVAGAGEWSLVAGQLASYAVQAAVLITLAPRRLRPGFDAAAARDTLRTGRGFLAQSALSFADRNADLTVISRSLGTAPLGAYALGFRLAELPYQAIAEPVARVTFPAFARMRERGEQIGPAFLSVLGLVALAACPLGILLSALADPFTRTVLGDQWIALIGPLGVLGLWAAVRPLQNTLAWALNSIGRQGLLARAQGTVLALAVPALVVAVGAGGLTAVAGVLLARTTVLLLVLAVLVRRTVGTTAGELLRATGTVLPAGAAAWLAAHGVAGALESRVPALLLGGLAGLTAYVVVVVAVQPRAPRRVRDVLRRMAGGSQ